MGEEGEKTREKYEKIKKKKNIFIKKKTLRRNNGKLEDNLNKNKQRKRSSSSCSFPSVLLSANPFVYPPKWRMHEATIYFKKYSTGHICFAVSKNLLVVGNGGEKKK